LNSERMLPAGLPELLERIHVARRGGDSDLFTQARKLRPAPFRFVVLLDRRPSGRHRDQPRSTTAFMLARPFSNSPPSILSIFMNRPNDLNMKLFLPVMLQVTRV